MANRKEYAAAYDSIKWLTPEAAVSAFKARESLVASIFDHSGSKWAFSNTKLFTHALSPGCRLCGQGTWSCLFINGICNASCFYCPSSQNDPGIPTTNSIAFKNPKDYADYVNRFNIQGVSFSGGEPFLTFDRVLSFLETLKTHADHPVYTWIYTNGILVTRDKLVALQERGLDEIRFDISADRYRLDALEKALGVIPNVTVEIPAIPEDLPMSKKVIVELDRMGVDYLNLHQIRCTPYNREHLAERGYTFLHGPSVTVLDTELAALELIRYALDRSITLPINYCCFTYQRQFQSMGARRRSAEFIKADYEDITPTGFIRRLTISGAAKAIGGIGNTLAAQKVDPSSYNLSAKKDCLSFSAGLWPLIDFSQVRLKVSYSQAVVRNSLSYYHPFKEIVLNNGKTVVVEKQSCLAGVWLDGDRLHRFWPLIRSQDGTRLYSDIEEPASQWYSDILPFETIRPGLAPYQ